MSTIGTLLQENNYMSNDTSKRFAERLCKLRKERGYSQEKFAEVCDLHRTYIGKLERLERNPTLPVLDRIARALDMELWELLKM